MGDGLLLPNKAEAFAIGTHLNAMFGVADFPRTKMTIRMLQVVYPELLVYDAGANGNKKRKSALRFAGWLLTSDIDFTHGGMHGYPANKFHRWLRWLTWIDRHKPNNTVVEQLDQADRATTLAEEPGQAIIETINQALASTVADANIEFGWGPSTAADPDLKVTVKRYAPDYKILVLSKRENQIPAGIVNNEDDELP